MEKEHCFINGALFLIICKEISKKRKCGNYVTLTFNCVTLAGINGLNFVP